MQSIKSLERKLCFRLGSKVIHSDSYSVNKHTRLIYKELLSILNSNHQVARYYIYQDEYFNHYFSELVSLFKYFPGVGISYNYVVSNAFNFEKGDIVIKIWIKL